MKALKTPPKLREAAAQLALAAASAHALKLEEKQQSVAQAQVWECKRGRCCVHCNNKPSLAGIEQHSAAFMQAVLLDKAEASAPEQPSELIPAVKDKGRSKLFLPMRKVRHAQCKGNWHCKNVHQIICIAHILLLSKWLAIDVPTTHPTQGNKDKTKLAINLPLAEGPQPERALMFHNLATDALTMSEDDFGGGGQLMRL